jgi:hypothetical protein
MMVVVVREAGTVTGFVLVMMFVGVGQMDIKLHAADAGFLLARDVKMITVEFQLLQLVLKPARIHAEVNQRADEHVAADAAENIEIKRFHFSASTLIWLAA